MKSIKNNLLILGLLVQVGTGFAGAGQTILDRIQKEKNTLMLDEWENVGPTCEDIKAATHVETQAAQGSKEYKLISALKNGNLKDVETLIPVSNLEARDDQNMTPLMIAAKNGHTDIASKLLKAGADIHAMNSFRWTALSYAIDNGHAGIVHILVAHGAAKKQNDLNEWFVSAVFNGKKDIVKALLAHEVDIDDATLNTACSFARDAEILSAIKERIEKLRS